MTDKNVDIHKAGKFGEQMMAVFTASLPAGFYKPLRSRLFAMEAKPKGVIIGDKTVFAMKLYGQMLPRETLH